MSTSNKVKFGIVGIVGLANVGKSTLLNLLVEEKISIVSDKPQTTRTNIRGIYNDSQTQIVFVDTPGIHNPKNKLGNNMLKISKNIIKQSDICVFVIDGAKPLSNLETQFIEYLKKFKNPKMLVINKIDLISNGKILSLIQKYSEFQSFDEIIPLSAKTSLNKSALLEVLKKYLPYGEKLYSEDIITDQSNSKLISEIIREKLLKYLSKEVPHGLAVEIEKITDDENKNLIEISALIYCEKKSHKKIIIGKNGRKLKGIGMVARKDLEELFGCKIHLSTWVKVKENWREDSFTINQLGFSREN